MSSYKYPINYQFTVEKNKKTYHGTIIKYAAMDEFGADFYALENNYEQRNSYLYLIDSLKLYW